MGENLYEWAGAISANTGRYSVAVGRRQPVMVRNEWLKHMSSLGTKEERHTRRRGKLLLSHLFG